MRTILRLVSGQKRLQISSGLDSNEHPKAYCFFCQYQTLAPCAMRILKDNKTFVLSNTKHIEEGMINLYDPVHPGEFIREMFMEPFEIPAAELADKLEVSQSTLSRLLNGKTDLSYEMALRLSKVIGRSAESWVNMQAQFSLSKSRKALANELAHLHPMFP
ncbi:HigA family addiction module antitoxin [Leclercia adecarboxylata]|jgi:addiction module HigA family antidote|uniref:HigA family addiction module antitoxin n=1 Tax=Leclercia adecarboxylata TaxID=83655 RepID=UPI001F402A08|nr:HigA family addiction module antitoxin [Leclercia adecarboxylata]MCE9980996.1 HigA family addiction module antitoxin [Leclercia adecarboxylata]